MKRLLALLVMFVILLSFTACSNNEEKTVTTCWNCGESISETAAFCSSCGSAVDDKANNTEPATSGTENTETNTESTNAPTDSTEDATETPTTIPPTTPPTTKPPATEATHTHSYNSKVTTAATCGKDGVKTFVCSCGSSYTEKIAATGQHSWKSATCTTPKTCANCNATDGSAAGHTWSSWSTVTPAEVGKAGQEKRTCSSCNQAETKEIPALQEDLDKPWFIAQYNLAKQQYINSLEKSKTSKQDDITDLQADIDYELDKYTDKRIEILNKYPPSATRDTMLTNAQQNYAAAIKPYKDKISRLESEIATIDAEIANPNVDSILNIVARNCGISSKEAYQYYNKYSSSLS